MWRSAIHVSVPVEPLCVVGNEVGVETGLHLVDGLVSLLVALNTEVLVEEGAVEAVDETVGLAPHHVCGPLFGLLALEEELVGVTAQVGNPRANVPQWTLQIA